MPRSSSPVRAPTRSAPVRPTPILSPTPAYAPPAASPTIGQAIKEGFGVGIGVSLANRVMSGLFGPPTIQVAQPAQPAQSVIHQSQPTPFEQCIAEHRDDVAVCAHLASNDNGSGQSNIKK